MQHERETYLTVKAAEQDGERWIEGWATTPSVDLVGDIVSPQGAVYSLPVPLLFAHRHDEPIGAVVRANASSAGIRIRARLTAGVAKAEECWNLVRDGALSAVSVGFQALKATPLPSGGQRFDSWRWLELSLVSVPANPDARIAVGKGLAYSAHPPVKHAPVTRQQHASPTAGGIDPEAFGEAMADVVREIVDPLRREVAELRQQAAGLKFLGEWQQQLAYPRGAVVRHREATYTATLPQPPGGQPPNRAGSGWTQL